MTENPQNICETFTNKNVTYLILQSTRFTTLCVNLQYKIMCLNSLAVVARQSSDCTSGFCGPAPQLFPLV